MKYIICVEIETSDKGAVDSVRECLSELPGIDQNEIKIIEVK